MTKFSARSDTGYKRVLDAIKMLLEGLAKDEKLSLAKEGMSKIVCVCVQQCFDLFPILLKVMWGSRSSLPSHSLTRKNLISHIQVTTFYDIPPLHVAHFVALKKLLSCLEKLFRPSTTTSSQLIVVLVGMGGSGKTQLALE